MDKPLDDTTYNRKVQKQQLEEQVRRRIIEIQGYKEKARNKHFEYTELMDFVELVIGACGGEKKANFVEASRDFMRLKTRVPLSANLFPFLPEDDKRNIRIHKMITKILLEVKQILGVRWVPAEEGCYLILSVRRE